MTDVKASVPGSPGGTDALKSPGAKLVEELGAYAETRLEHVLAGVGHKVGDAANRIGSAHLEPGALVHGLGKGGKLLGGQASQAKEGAVHAKDAVTDKIKQAAGHRHGSSRGGARSMTVIEDIDIGVPVREAYEQWTRFTEFGRSAEDVTGVEEAKIAKAGRAWTGTIIEQVPDERIAWISEGAGGTTSGVVTFHPVAENLTKVLLVLDHIPQGFVEKTGNLWRAQGRRARLDLKRFRKFVMLREEIRDGELVRGLHEEYEEEDLEARGEDQTRVEDVEDDEEYEDDEAQPEDRYDERDQRAARDTDADTAADEEEPEDEDEDEYDEEEDEEPEDRDEEPPAESRRRRS
ncbi:SRPBCC family protein [Streptomyces sp. NPDC086077]|uniref:SRPBCC family protein n=1 Tax=Streptomyces sp. NPDC086077 TaxID=3154862 RepID=UPI003438CDC5